MSGECVFIPRSDDAGEDEGYAMSLVYDKKRDTSELVVIDAAHFSASPLAVVQLPTRVPFGIHGDWFADGMRAA
jgi:carotenoid cleavage dioxygenase-like enzyme